MAEPRIGSPKIVNPSPLQILGRPIQRYVDILGTTRDGGTDGAATTGDSTTKLEPGLLLCRIESGTNVGKYTHYATADDTINNPENVVVLQDFVDVASGERKGHIALGTNAIFKREQMRYHLVADKTALTAVDEIIKLRINLQ